MNEYFFPVRIVFGCGLFKELPGLISDISANILIVTGRESFRSSGRFAGLTEGLSERGIRYLIHESVSPDPVVGDIDRISKELKDSPFDLVLAVGGGSVMDFGKCLALMKNYKGGSVWDFVNMPGRRATQVAHKVLPIVTVPTTAGSGSEATPFSVLTNKGEGLKKGIGHKTLYPSLSVVDPELTLSLSSDQTLYSGLDAFCHSLESYIGKGNSPLTETFCLYSMELVARSLLRVLEEPLDLDARGELSLAAMYSGMIIGQTDVGLAHAIGQAISTFFPLPHGQAVSLVTPEVVKFNSRAIEEKIERVDSIIKRHTPADNICQFFRLAGLNFGLSNYGIAMDDLDAISESASHIGSIKTNPLPVMRGVIKDILIEAFDGQ